VARSAAEQTHLPPGPSANVIKPHCRSALSTAWIWQGGQLGPRPRPQGMRRDGPGVMGRRVTLILVENRRFTCFSSQPSASSASPCPALRQQQHARITSGRPAQPLERWPSAASAGPGPIVGAYGRMSFSRRRGTCASLRSIRLAGNTPLGSATEAGGVCHHSVGRGVVDCAIGKPLVF